VEILPRDCLYINEINPKFRFKGKKTMLPTSDVKKMSILSRFRLTPLGSLNATQILGTMNDNIFKLLTVFYFISIEGQAASNSILSAVGALYVIPFLLLSSIAGTMADRYSKRSIIVGAKIAECSMMLVGLLSFYLGNKGLAYSCIFLLACHSTIFAPCKFGIVPEIVPRDRISKANGLISSCTYIAIIIGTFLASFLVDVTNRNFIVASCFSILFAFMGLYTSLKLPKTAPAGSDRTVSPKFLTELIRNLKLIKNEPSLLTAVCGSAFFLFVGSYIQLNMIPFALDALGLSDVAGGYLFLLCALGIGIGSILAGKLSGKRVELGLVPIGGLGISLCAFLMSFFTFSLTAEVILITLIGIFGGLYLIPLDSYIQFASPNILRGQVIASTNFLGFFGVLCSAGMLYLLGPILGLNPSDGFFVIGVLALAFVSCISLAISGYIVRYFSMLKAYFGKAFVIHGQTVIAQKTPSLYFSALSEKCWVTFLTAIQPRRVTVFTLKKSKEPYTFKRKCIERLTSRYSIESVDELNPKTKLGKILLKSLARGASVALFANDKELTHFHNGWDQLLTDLYENRLAMFCLQEKTALFPENYPLAVPVVYEGELVLMNTPHDK
jgi:acyl-[acyl-carrier-protein]-phospholipid O-acyltransferase / long-chain-fatty-acid--[acyl-carrier-protein] ligase